MKFTTLLLSGLLSLAIFEDAHAQESLTPQSLRATLAAKPSGDEASRLAEKVRTWFGKGNLATGAKPKIDALNVAWAIEAAGENPAPAVVSEDGTFRLPLVRLGATDVYGASVELPNGTGMKWAYEVGGK
ncbi:MAG: enterochelin esterase, partial [Armatimonadota bacterium]|nr:enterochelin esterase [Armatimonadota bacterium]